jgi:hypothetical protein
MSALLQDRGRALFDGASYGDAPCALVDPAIAQRALAASAAARRGATVGARCEEPRVQVALEVAVFEAWEALSAHSITSCLVCGGRMAPRYGSAARPLGGRCADCGTTLS